MDHFRLDIDMSANMFMVQCKEAISSLERLVSEITGSFSVISILIISIRRHNINRVIIYPQSSLYQFALLRILQILTLL